MQEELSKSAEETHREMEPRTEAEAKRAQGEVPYSTEELLGGSRTGMAPQTPPAGTGVRSDAEDALAKVSDRESFGRARFPLFCCFCKRQGEIERFKACYRALEDISRLELLFNIVLEI